MGNSLSQWPVIANSLLAQFEPAAKNGENGIWLLIGVVVLVGMALVFVGVFAN